MTHAARLFFVLLAVLLAHGAQAITGTEYRNLEEARREAWVIGAVDGILTAQLWLTKKEPEISKCVAGKHPTQIKAIFEKALEASPEVWHFPAAFQLLTTLQEFCSVTKVQ